MTPAREPQMKRDVWVEVEGVGVRRRLYCSWEANWICKIWIILSYGFLEVIVYYHKILRQSKERSWPLWLNFHDIAKKIRWFYTF